MPAELDLNKVRASFPALSRGQVHFDNAAGSQVLGSVADRVRDYLLFPNITNDGYQAAADFINASPDDIVFGSSTTQLLHNLSQALSFSPGDENLLSPLDHESNITPWLSLANCQNLTIKWWHPDTTTSSSPHLSPSSLPDLLSPKTRLVCLTHTSNILGTIHLLPSITSTIRSLAPQALICVDGVAFAPHRKIDVKELGVDFYVFSWYKVFGPRVSQLYASPRARSQLQSLGHFFNPSETLDEKIGLAGGWCQELIYGVAAVVGYLAPRWEGIVKQEGELQRVLLGWLNSRKGVTIYGERSDDTETRVPTVSFRVEGWGARELVEAVEKETNGRFKIRWGSYYSVRLTKGVLGLDGEDGVVRVSLVHYNTVNEVESLIEAVEKVLAEGKR
ncbi:pyridoxal phosphate-dependent transferase [Apiosordaria backusii]|uniref:Pyridoxal phosphate-dependent transferase n=1 Tax=Apiosordaria backusii TaxID=314023 RepID=A0AA40AMY6_9PEZI|nr:pyridoxal phosphate-dependent transferase [Apiosordaria backusii]